MRILVINHVTLDGVLQGPGRPDEDTRGGFDPLSWPNSTLLAHDAADAVAELKEQPGQDIATMGSSELIRSLIPRGLIDEYMLMIHPLVLGGGLRLFVDDGVARSLRLVDSTTTTTGVVIATYSTSG